jgi:hypothetical protein
VHRILPLALAAASIGVFANAAHAAPCWKRVIDDWSKNNVLDRTYKQACYREAVAHLPFDMRLYTSAGRDILDAMRDTARERAAAPAPHGVASPRRIRQGIAAAHATRTLAAETATQPVNAPSEREASAAPASAQDGGTPTIVLVVGAAVVCFAAWAVANRLGRRRE